MPNPYLVPVLPFTPEILERLFKALPAEALDEAEPGRFSPREVIAHMADWEPILLARLHQTVDQPGSTLEIWDEGQMALDHNYAGSDPGEQLRLFADRRKDTVGYLKNLAADDWQKRVTHPERGELSVYDQATMILGHDIYHIEQVSALLSGTPMSVN